VWLPDPRRLGSGCDRLGPGFQPSEEFVRSIAARRLLTMILGCSAAIRSARGRRRGRSRACRPRHCNVGTEVNRSRFVVVTIGSERTPDDADRAARPRDILDHEGLASASVLAVAEDARHRVPTDTRGERHHDGDRARREVVRVPLTPNTSRCDQRRKDRS